MYALCTCVRCQWDCAKWNVVSHALYRLLLMTNDRKVHITVRMDQQALQFPSSDWEVTIDSFINDTIEKWVQVLRRL